MMVVSTLSNLACHIYKLPVQVQEVTTEIQL
jgi:hypothetical protein